MFYSMFSPKNSEKVFYNIQFAIASMIKKQYLCSGFKNRHNLFCTLKIKQTNTMEK